MTTSAKKDSASGDPKKADHDQALQINENTIEDPEQPVVDVAEESHGRTDVPERDQALQINENTIADPGKSD